MMVTMIPRAALDDLWPVLWPLLERAARRAKPEAVAEADARSTVESGHAELWAVFDGPQPVAAITTQLTTAPERRCRIWLVGGARMDEWAADFMTMIERWARDWGCKAIWGTQCRPGWAPIVALMGGEPIDTANGVPAWGRRL